MCRVAAATGWTRHLVGAGEAAARASPHRRGAIATRQLPSPADGVARRGVPDDRGPASAVRPGMRARPQRSRQRLPQPNLPRGRAVPQRQQCGMMLALDMPPPASLSCQVFRLPELLDGLFEPAGRCQGRPEPELDLSIAWLGGGVLAAYADYRGLPERSRAGSQSVAVTRQPEPLARFPVMAFCGGSRREPSCWFRKSRPWTVGHRTRLARRAVRGGAWPGPSRLRARSSHAGRRAGKPSTARMPRGRRTCGEYQPAMRHPEQLGLPRGRALPQELPVAASKR